jgi:Antibiotic biosynthesis monooxygenase
VVISQWTAGTRERQQAAAEVILAAWERVPWPADLLALSSFLSTDGERVLSYAQWKSAEAVPEFMHTHGPSLGRGLDQTVPGLERTGPVAYRLYRSGVREGAPAPGCIVVVSVAFDGPDERRQRQWVDAVFEAMAADADPPAGGISGHFHLAIDRTRVLNYAEWTSEDAHRAALERSGQGTVGSSPSWRRVTTFPGVISGGFKRYQLLRSLSPLSSRE